jgi:ABC-type dipeptide/oligopeptide/nickel transport system ATPase component
MKITGYIGAAGSGKSTKMREIILTLGEGTIEKSGMIYYHLFPEAKSVVIGVYDEKTFSGTDRLNMAISIKFRTWAEETFLNSEYDDWTMYWEGQRFSTAPMFEFFYKNFDTTIYLLDTPQEVLDERQNERGNVQSSSFLKGSKTRVENLAIKFPAVVRVQG